MPSVSHRLSRHLGLVPRPACQLLLLAAGYGAYLLAVLVPEYVGRYGFLMVADSAVFFGGLGFRIFAQPTSMSWEEFENMLTTLSLCQDLLAPLVFFGAAIALLRWQARWIGIGAKTVLWLCWLVALLDIPGSLFFSAFGTEAFTAIFAGVPFTVFCWCCLFLAMLNSWSTSKSLGRLTIWRRIFAAPLLMFSCWSALSGVVAGGQAAWLADSQPYCIASAPPYHPIDSIFDLRGANFYTSSAASEYPYYENFHAVLIVLTDDGPRYWNWSIRSMRFDPLPQHAVESVRTRSLCPLEEGFISGLIWS